jgi:polyisoprenoid-binding protein YceI
MMVTYVRGHFKDVHGTLEFDLEDPTNCSVAVTIDARKIWTGEPDRDAHLRSGDFLDVEHYPEITFTGKRLEITGAHDSRLSGDLTIRGVTRPVTMNLAYLGKWETPWWEDGADKGPRTRAGFLARTKINRHDFGVSWNDSMAKGGIVVGHTVDITIDVEAVLEGG